MIDTKKLRYVKELSAIEDMKPHRAFHSFVKCTACAVSVGQREDEYLREVKHLSKETLEVYGRAIGALTLDMEEFAYQDVLGPYYEEISSKSDRDQLGEFFTPPEVSLLLNRLILPDEWPEGHLTLHEPSVGSGGTLLATVEEMALRKISPDRVFFECWDISEASCDMTYINLALHGVPARIVWGDTLRMKVNASWRTPFEARQAGPDWRAAFDLIRCEEPVTGPEIDDHEGKLFGKEIA